MSISTTSSLKPHSLSRTSKETSTAIGYVEQDISLIILLVSSSCSVPSMLPSHAWWQEQSSVILITW